MQHSTREMVKAWGSAGGVGKEDKAQILTDT